MLNIGYVTKRITPKDPENVFLGGYSARNHNAIGVHDDLYAKAVCFQSVLKNVVWVTLDAVGVPQDLYVRIRDGIREKYGVSGIVVSATHDHSAPEPGLECRDINGSWCEEIVQTAIEAAGIAIGSCKPMSLYAGFAHVPSVTKNRRGEDAVDDELFVMWFTDLEGSIKGIVANYACHCTVLDANNYLVSSDYAGYFRDKLAERFGADFVMFSNAACGNLNIGYSADASALGADMGDVRTYANAEKKARELVSAMPEIFDNAEKQSDDFDFTAFRYTLPLKKDLPSAAELEKAIADLGAKANTAGSEEERTALEVQKIYLECILSNVTGFETEGKDALTLDGFAFRIGKLVFLTVPVELFCEIGLEIKQSVPDGYKLVLLGYSNGYHGYLPTEKAFAAGGYECETSVYAPDASRSLVNEAVRQIRELLARS